MNGGDFGKNPQKIIYKVLAPHKGV